MKDNRVDAFIKVVGFEFDEPSGLYLPRGEDYLVNYGTVSSWTSPEISFDSLQKDLKRIGFFESTNRGFNDWPPASFLVEKPNWTLYWGVDGTSEVYNDGVDNLNEDDLGDSIQRWLDDLEEERT